VSLVSSTSLVLVSPLLNPDKLNVGSVVYNSSGASALIQTKTLTTIYTISNVQGLWSIGDKVYVAETVGSGGITVSQFEGDSGITSFLFTVTRSGDLRNITTVNWAVSASGTNPANQFDFQGSVFPSGVITFSPGVATQVITVNVQGDAIVEPNKTFQVTLFNPQNGTVINSVAQGVIINDDNFFVPPDLNQNIVIDQQVRSQFSVEETKQTLITSINTPEAEIFLTPLIISARPLNQSFDNEIVTIEVSFTERPVGQPDYNFLAKQDENGVFFLLKNNPGPGEVGVVLRDRNQNGRIDGATLFLKDRISESQTVRETGDLDPRPGYVLDPIVPVVISSVVSDLRLAWLSNNDSSTTQRFLTWLLASDSTNSSSSLLSWLPPSTAGETLPLVSFSTPNLSLPEGINNQSTVFNFQVVRTRELNVNTTVSWAVVGTGSNPADASDFVGNAFPTGVLTFQIGQSTQTISVLVQGDDQLEANETFSVILSNAVNGEIGNGVATGTILNDDSEATLAIVATDAIKPEGNAGITFFLFQVTRSGNLNPTATVDWAVTGTGSNPANANDFVNGVFPSGSLTFAPGQSSQSIAVPVQADTIVELSETFTVTLSNATNAIITSATATSTITNDDQEVPTPSITPTVSWARLLGTAARDEIFAIKTTTDGSIIVSGQTFGNFDNPTLINNDSQVFLAKYSSGGIRDWTRQLNSTSPNSNDSASGIDIASDGSIYVTGTTQGNLGDQGLIGGRDVFLAKYNSLGTLVWIRLLGTTADDRGNSVVVGSDGFIYLTGSTDGNLASQSNAGQSDTFVAKYDTNGNRIWLSLLGTSGTDIGYSISTSTEGSLYIAGTTTGSISPETGFGSNDAFLAKYNPDGTRNWVKQLGTDKIDQALAVTVSSDGFIYIAGGTQGNLHGEVNPSIDYVSSAFLSKYNSSGTRIWTKILGTTTTDTARAITSFSNFIFISGSTYGNLDGQTGLGWTRAFVSKYDINGERLWTKLLSSTADTSSNALTTDSEGAVYIAGKTQSSILEGQIKEIDVYSNFDAFLVKIQES
jgi:hypothetical protein